MEVIVKLQHSLLKVEEMVAEVIVKLQRPLHKRRSLEGGGGGSGSHRQIFSEEISLASSWTERHVMSGSRREVMSDRNRRIYVE